MKKTISQRFFLSLCLMIVGCLWGSAAWAETVTYTVTSKSTVTTSGTAPSGSEATYSSTYSTTAQLIKGKSMTLTLSGYAGKKITGITLSMKSNSNDGAGYLSVKAGTTTLASIGSPSSGVKFNNRAWYGKWSTSYVNVTPTMSNDAYAIQYNEDVVILIGATESSLYCQSFTLTYEDAGPTLLVPSEPISFGDIETGYNDTKTFSISGMKLTADATLEITGTNAAMFSVSPTTITATDGNIAAKDVTVTYTPTTTGTHSATLTISSGDLSREVSLSGTGIAPLTHYTVSWMVNGETYTEGTPSTDVAEGKKVETLPTNPAAIGSNVFMGWRASTISGTLASAPDGLFTTAKDAPVVTGNTTYYAVFAKLSSSTSSWNRVKTLAEITDGSYVIKNSNFILPSTTTSSNPSAVTAPTITEDEITGSVEESMIWHLTSTGTANQFFVQNASRNYLTGTDGSTSLKVNSTSDQWTFAVNTTNYFSMIGKNGSRYCAKYKSGNDWRSYTSATASNYANGGKLELYKLVSEGTYTDYATTIAAKADRELSFGATTAFEVYNNTFDAPTLTGTTTGVTYASSNASVATVNESTGVITLAGGLGTTTITASAAEDETYNAGEASYTLTVWPNSIGGIKTMITGTVDFKAALTNATITYVNGRNVYLQDANDAILLYLAEGHGLLAGKSYTGQVSGTATLYNGLHEITSIDLSGITPTDNTIEPQTVTLAELNADYDAYESKYIKVADVTTGTFNTSGSYQTTTLTKNEATLQFSAPSALSLVDNNDYDFVGFLGKYNDTPQFRIYEQSQAINKGKEEAGLAFEQATYTAEVNEIITVTATNTSEAEITYSVDDETHAAVDNNGNFMADAVGTYTITATCPATLTHSAGTATCQVIVTQPAANIHATTYYKKITSSDELVDGGQYVIVYTAGEKGLLAGASNIHNATPADVIFEGNGTISTANAAAMTEITFEKYSTNTYYLKIGDNKYIKATSGETYLNVVTDKDEYSPWVIAFDAAGNVEITSKKIDNRGIMYSTNSTGYFKNYDVSKRGQAAYPAIQLYQKVGEMPIAKATGYVSTYVADFAYVMPKHITGHTVALADKKDVIITEKAFRAGDEVPALTPLLIKSDEDYAAEETSRNYNPAVLNKTVDAYTGANMLEYRRTAENYTNTMKNGNVYYYKLAIKEGNVGFYWGAADGAAFIMTKPSTAYLTVPQTIKVQGFVLNLEEGATTGIATVVTNEDAPIYNLQGIRMNGKNLPKGIYIQGGKKFMVK